MASRLAQSGAEPKLKPNAPHDERTDVKLAGDWLDRWLLELDQAED